MWVCVCLGFLASSSTMCREMKWIHPVGLENCAMRRYDCVLRMKRSYPAICIVVAWHNHMLKRRASPKHLFA